MYYDAKDFNYSIEGLLADYYDYVKNSKSYKFEDRSKMYYSKNTNSYYERPATNVNDRTTDIKDRNNISDRENMNTRNYMNDRGNMNNRNNMNDRGSMNNRNDMNNWNNMNDRGNMNNRNSMNDREDMNNQNDMIDEREFNDWNRQNREFMENYNGCINNEEVLMMYALYTEINRALMPYVIEVLNQYNYSGSPLYDDEVSRESIAQVVDQVIRKGLTGIDGVDEINISRNDEVVFEPWSRWTMLRATVEALVLSELFGIRRNIHRRLN